MEQIKILCKWREFLKCSKSVIRVKRNDFVNKFRFYSFGIFMLFFSFGIMRTLMARWTSAEAGILFVFLPLETQTINESHSNFPEWKSVTRTHTHTAVKFNCSRIFSCRPWRVVTLIISPNFVKSSDDLNNFIHRRMRFFF